MLLLYAKYVFIFWVLIGGNQGDVLFLQRISQDQKLFEISACTARCIQQHRLHREQEAHRPNGTAHTKPGDNLHKVYDKTGKGYLDPEMVSPFVEKFFTGEDEDEIFELRMNFRSCFEICSNDTKGDVADAGRAPSTLSTLSTVTDARVKFRKISENLNLKLICRSDNSLTFRIDLNSYNSLNKVMNFKTSHNYTSADLVNETEVIANANNLNNLTDIVYIIKINAARNAKETLIYLSDENFFVINNLRSNTVFNLTVFAMHVYNEYSMISQDQPFSTLQRGFTPGEVPHIEVVKYLPDPLSPHRLKARVVWKPPPDMNCDYDIIYFSNESIDFDGPIEIRNPRGLFNCDIGNIKLDASYKVGVRSINRVAMTESALVWHSFTSPACLPWHSYSYSLCAPLEPSGLNVSQNHFSKDNLALNVTWQKPKYLPDFYTLRILDLYPQGNLFTFRLKKESQELQIPKILIRGASFQIILTATTIGGNSTASKIYTKEPQIIIKSDNGYIKILIALSIPIFCVTLFTLTVVCGGKARLKRYKKRCKYLEERETKMPQNNQSTLADGPYSGMELFIFNENSEMLVESFRNFNLDDEMEIDGKEVELHEILGEGAFGLVRRGWFKQLEVAVKMLRDEPTMEDVQAFRHEIEFMKSVGKHPNIIGLVGHCTRRLNSMMLLIEFCSLGNLLNFLRDEWKFRQEKHNHRNVRQIKSVADDKQQLNKLHYAFDNVETHIETLDDSSQMPVKLPDASKQLSMSAETIIEMHTMPAISSTLSSVNMPKIAAEHISYGLEENSSKRTDAIDVAVQNIDAYLEKGNLNHGKCESCVNQQNCKQQRSLASVDNKAYFLEKDIKVQPHNQKLQLKNEQRQPINEEELLDIARQVAIGMEFLAKNKIVHRDLAARNILVTADRTIKIADFGLSRDIYHDNVYKKTGSGKLPLKWMALESLTHQVYTTKSDVWSFGILLFEIMTLGSIPYPTISSDRLIKLLCSGYRMPKPEECSDKVYSIMYACWNSVPAQRPSFTDLIKELNNLLGHGKQSGNRNKQIEYVTAVASLKNVSNDDATQFENSYLEPLN